MDFPVDESSADESSDDEVAIASPPALAMFSSKQGGTLDAEEIKHDGMTTRSRKSPSEQ